MKEYTLITREKFPCIGDKYGYGNETVTEINLIKQDGKYTYYQIATIFDDDNWNSDAHYVYLEK